MIIVKDLRVHNKYRFTHLGCCEFIAEGNEFKWTTVGYNETVADVICPQCGKQFYDSPTVIPE